MVEKLIPIHLEKIDSTNSYAKENYRHFDLSVITRITASEQTKGRGRYNRPWSSPKNVNIYVTYFFTVSKETDLSNLAQVVALSLAKLINKEGLKPQIKWPNDVLINDKKIAGILCEMIDLNDKSGVVLGIGVNVNMEKNELDQIDQPATSLLLETGKIHDKNLILKTFDHYFLEDYKLYKEEGFKPFYMSYDELLIHKGTPITLDQCGTMITGNFHSLNPDGRLNLLLPNGEIKTISSGEIKRYTVGR